MEKSIPSNSKIKYFLLSILFSVLFILTAFPTTAQARPADFDGTAETSLGQVANLASYGSNETDESSNEQAGYLYWAASSKRCGIMYYVVDNVGKIQAKGIMLDEAGKEEFGNYALEVNTKLLGSRAGGFDGSALAVHYSPNVSPVAYNGGWQATGSNVMNYLMEIDGKIRIKGIEMDCPRWARFVLQTAGGATALKELAKPDTHWSVIIEPVSVNYMYTNNTFTNDTINSIDADMVWSAGNPMPVGATNSDGWTPNVYMGTGYQLLLQSNRINGEGGGTYTYKFYNTQLPYSLCLEHDLQVPAYIGGAVGPKITFKVVSSSVHRIYNTSEIIGEGIAMASIDREYEKNSVNKILL